MKLFSSKPHPVSHQPRQSRYLIEFLLITSAIATSAGVGFGGAIRLNRPEKAGSTIFHSEQSFPPRQDWPISNRTEGRGHRAED